MTPSSYNIKPVFVSRGRQEYDHGTASAIFRELANFEDEIACTSGPFSVEGFCIPCGKTVLFAVDMLAGGQCEGGKRVPNWRERLVCPRCKMSNRQRLMAALVMQLLKDASSQQVYLMEQTTSLYRWVARHLPDQVVIGSEYFGDGFHGGETVKAWRYHVPVRLDALFCTIRHKASLFYTMLRMGGIRHEDVTELSFRTDSLDMIVSSDVFEHVPDTYKAFSECSRVLRPGGVMLTSIPFNSDYDVSVKRAESEQDGPRHFLPPVHHGNPLSAEGSLVYTDFGWDVIRFFKEAGFSEVVVEVYASADFGHLGGGQLIFKAKK